MKDVLYGVYNFYVVYLLFHAVNSLFEKRLGTWQTYLTEFACIAVQVTLVLGLGMNQDVLRMAVFPILLYILPTQLLFRGSILRKLAVSLCAFFGAAAAEMVTFMAIPELMNQVHFGELQPISWVVYLSVGGCNTLVDFVIYLIFRSRKNRELSRISTAQGWIFLLFPVSQYILLTLWFRSFGENFSTAQLPVILAVVVLCIAADVLLFYEMKVTADRARLKAENELLNSRIEAKNGYYQSLSQNYTDMSRLRHDIANHIYTMKILLQDGKRAEALEYAEELSKNSTVKTVISDCRNSVVHSFLTHRMAELEQKQIGTDFRVVLPAELPVVDTDLIIALGNLLDNAEEACTGVDNASISLKAELRDGFVRIETENPVIEGKKDKKRRIPYLERGIGSTILRSLAERYHGNYIGRADNDRFFALLTLRGE